MTRCAVVKLFAGMTRGKNERSALLQRLKTFPQPRLQGRTGCAPFAPAAWMPSCANTASTKEKVFLGDFFAPAKKLHAPKERKLCTSNVKNKKELDSGLTSSAVVKLFAGMTSGEEELDSSLRWNDEQKDERKAKALDSGLTSSAVVKPFAGMTS